jgi:AcrR family transcriptional regulator
MNDVERTRLAPDVRQAQVLAAARDVFLRSGLLGTTVKAIADTVGVTETAIYHHFASKDELFRKAVEEPLHRLVTDVRNEMRELVDKPSTSRRALLAAANEVFLGAMVEIAPLLAVTLFGEAERGREFYTTEIWPQLNQAIEALITAGWDLDRADPELATLGFLGVHYGVVMDSVLADEVLDVPRAAAQITALFEGSIRAESPIPQPAPKRRERLTASHRRPLILQAAREAFLDKGLTGTRMKDIASRAGLSDAGLYAHFESKDELYQAAVQEPLERLVGRFTSDIGLLSAGPDVDRQALLLRANEQLLACMVELTPLLAVALFSELDKGRVFYREVFLPRLEEATLGMVRGIYGAEAPPDDDLDIVVEAMLGVHFGVALDNLMRGRQVDVPKVAARLSELITLPSADPSS